MKAEHDNDGNRPLERMVSTGQQGNRAMTCQKCGASGLHACLGVAIPNWTAEDRARLETALALLAKYDEGFQLVPTEPTYAMLRAAEEGADTIVDCECGNGVHPNHDDARQIWKAMLGAAPKSANA